jgi:hypothetical protein
MVIRRSKESILRNGSGTLAPQPRQSRFIRPALRKSGRTSAPRAMQRSRFAIVSEVITTAAMVALVLYVLFPPN